MTGWLRLGDTLAMCERFLRLGRPAPKGQTVERYAQLNTTELRGLHIGVVVVMATIAGQQRTDGFVADEVIEMACGPEHPALVAQLQRAGWLTVDRRRRGIQLDISDPNVLHLMTEAERLSRSDSRHGLTTAEKLRILLRDGDQCRYCGIYVNPKDTKGGTRRDFDHVTNDGPSTAANMVVACSAHNGLKADGTPASVGLTLMPPPRDRGDEPHYHSTTLNQLQAKGLLRSDGTPTQPEADQNPVRPAHPSDDDPSTTATASTTRATDPGMSSAKRAPGTTGMSSTDAEDHAADQTPTRGRSAVVPRVGSVTGSGRARRRGGRRGRSPAPPLPPLPPQAHPQEGDTCPPD